MIKMKYIGKNSFTIKTGQTGTLIAIKRVRNNVKYFPSGIMLLFSLSDGIQFGWSDRKDWVRIKTEE